MPPLPHNGHRREMDQNMTDLYAPRGFVSPFGATPGGASSRYVLPSFIERTNYGMKESNPYNKLFEERIIFLGAPIDDVVANDVMAQLIALQSTDPDRDI